MSYKDKAIKVGGGADYLKVMHRILWFREEHPDWCISTSFVELAETHTVAKAEVYDEKGRLVSTGHKYAAKGHQGAKLAYHRECAETGAVGRALGFLGYGTEAAFAEDDDDNFIADAPHESRDKADFDAAVAPDKSGSYVVGFGKFKGMALSAVGEKEIKDYCNFLAKMAKAENKPLSESAVELIDAVKSFYGPGHSET